MKSRLRKETGKDAKSTGTNEKDKEVGNVNKSLKTQHFQKDLSRWHSQISFNFPPLLYLVVPMQTYW